MPSEPAGAPPVPGRPIDAHMESGLAPAAGDLLSLPFDQYGRMRIVQNILLDLYTEIARSIGGPEEGHPRLRVLDVGGYPGVLPKFLSSDYFDVSVLDVAPDAGTIANYTQGSGLDLPFDNGEFSIVTSLDTLEHIPATDRDRFLAEIMRVAGHAVVLANPVQTVEADLAEETLNEYIRWILDAQQEQLAEHRAYGLPNLEATIKALEVSGWSTLHFPAANVYNWLLMMIAKHYLLAMRDDKASSFERTLDRYYNLTFSEGDRAEPAYRGVIVAVRRGLEPALDAIRKDYPPVVDEGEDNAVRLGLTNVLMSLLNLKTANHEDRLLREQMERRDKHIAGMEARVASLDTQVQTLTDSRRSYEVEFEEHRRYIADLEARFGRMSEDLKNKDDHILYLEDLLRRIQEGRVMRLTRALSRFLGR